MATAKQLDAHERRMLRLRHELEDEGIWLPGDEALLALLLAELDYARHPHAHEGVAPRYGAIPATPDAMRRQPAAALEVVDIQGVPLNVARRLADGRSSFVARIVGGGERLVCFDRTREYESSAVHLALATDALVVQRLGRGWIRLSTPNGVSTFDGIRWSAKRLPVISPRDIASHVPGADRDVLTNIVELCTHWLGAGRVGASLVWSLVGDPRELRGAGMSAAVEIPRLDLSHRAHFAARSSTRCRSTTAPPSSTRRESSPRWACSS